MFEENGIRYHIDETDQTASVTISFNAKGTVFIPHYVKFNNKNFKVISIDDRAFEYTHLESLEFSPDSEVKSFGSALDSASIRKLQIPSSLEEIDLMCFFNTKDLVDIEVSPDNKHFSYIEDKYLLGKSDPNLNFFDTLIFARTDLEEAIIPPNIKYLKENSLKNCNEIKTIIFPEDSKVETIDDDVLCWYFDKLVLSKNLKSISEGAFDRCENLKEIEVSPQNQSFKIIENKILLEKNEETKQFDKLVFIINKPEEVTIPRSIKKINKNVINYESLKRLNFPKDSQMETIETIKLNSLEKLTIPKNLKEIDTYCFFDAKCIKKIEVSPENKFYTLLDNKYLLKKSEGSQIFDIFVLCPRNIEKVTIPKYVKEISMCAFRNCEELNSVSFESNSSLETLDKFAFADCDKLKSIVFPKSVKSFGLHCFYYSYRLQFVQILGEKVCIDSDCFEYCKNLKTISFPNVKKLKFYSCISVDTKVQVPKEAKLEGSIIDEYKDNIEYIEENTISEIQPNDEIETLKKENDELKEQIKKQEINNQEQQNQIKEQQKQMKKQKAKNQEQQKQIKFQTDEINKLKKQINELKKQIKEIPSHSNSQSTINQPFFGFRILERETVQSFHNIKTIGRGQAGKVSKIGIEKIYAVKYMNTDDDFSIERFKRFMAEYEILSMLDHPNIIKVFGFYNGDETNQPLILMEFCPDNLDKLIKNQELSNYDKVIIIYQIVEGFKYVHYKGIIHRDIKPKNILVNDDKTIKICDFGISKVVSPDETTLTTGIGTTKFMAPEIINEEKNYTEKIDIYSFGVLMFLIICEKLPNITVPAIAAGKMAKIPSNVNNFSRELIEKCWNINPQERPSFEKISNMIKEVNYELVELSEFEKKDVLSFVQNHNKKIPKYNQPQAPTFSEIKQMKSPRPSITQPKIIKQPKSHKK